MFELTGLHFVFLKISRDVDFLPNHVYITRLLAYVLNSKQNIFVY